MSIVYFLLVLLCWDIDAVRTGDVLAIDDLCEPNYCGIQANCERGRDEHGNDIRICTCPLGFVGNPNVTCVRGLCLDNNDCLDHLLCEEFLCKNPCTVSTCAKHASCTVFKHQTICACPEGHDGDPRQKCTYSPEPPSIEAITVNPSSQGFNFENGTWFIGENLRLRGFNDSILWCSDRNAEMFIPRTETDVAYYDKFRRSTSNDQVWFPITDIETEGSVKWTNGKVLTQQDENRIKWANSTVYAWNIESRDCGALSPRGVGLVECHFESHVLCNLKKQK